MCLWCYVQNAASGLSSAEDWGNEHLENYVPYFHTFLSRLIFHLLQYGIAKAENTTVTLAKLNVNCNQLSYLHCAFQCVVRKLLTTYSEQQHGSIKKMTVPLKTVVYLNVISFSIPIKGGFFTNTQHTM